MLIFDGEINDGFDVLMLMLIAVFGADSAVARSAFDVPDVITDVFFVQCADAVSIGFDNCCLMLTLMARCLMYGL
jgi:hypothetical protein